MTSEWQVRYGQAQITWAPPGTWTLHVVTAAGKVLEGSVAVEGERGPAYAAYLRSALANPAIIGCHWFQYVDEPLTGRMLDGENGHMGFVSVADIPYAGLVFAAREANLALLKSLQ